MERETQIDQAMILAAGLGTRMRPLTLKVPKPLVKVGGKALLQYALDALNAAKITKVVMNVHHLANQIEQFVEGLAGFDVQISDERLDLLDSGGGIKHALPLFSQNPFILLNADTFWIEEPECADSLSALCKAFAPENMDILLMLVPLDRTTGHEGQGDFVMADDGRLARFKDRNLDENCEPLIYAGVAILKPSIFDDIKARKFSLNRCFDTAIAQGSLFGQIMHGHWITVGTMEAIDEAEQKLIELRSDQ